MSSTTTCVTDTSVIPFPTLDSASNQSSNTATGPLPYIPCRNPRNHPLSLSDASISDSTTSDSVDYALQDVTATFVRYDSGSSSSSSTPSDEIRPIIIPRSKRVVSPHSAATDSRDIFSPITPSTLVKPRVDGRLFTGLENKKHISLDPSGDEDTLQPFPVLRQAPFCKIGKLRLEGSTVKHVRHFSDSNVVPPRPPVPEAVTLSVNQPSQTVRKKSGQPVKSSLKSARRPELRVVTDGPFAKSEPATPTHTKAVHFDSKLEHVKLFLAEQKPLAVSRDGSPTSDTSGDEFPSFIYGRGAREDPRVKMLVPNMPSSPRMNDNVALQALVLSQDQRTITGSVRVRNIAFEKWLAVRFTLDWWQTTSEVTARYDKSIEGGAFDVFTFAIRVHDIWSRIREKTIFLALRYTVAGQEFWDNNAGKNYQIKFALEPPTEPSSAVDNETSLKDLSSRLEDLEKARSAPVPIAPYRLGRSFSADHQYSSFVKPSATRHDFASAHRPLRAKDVLGHARTFTDPSDATAPAAVAPRSNKPEETGRVTPSQRSSPPLALGSPREAAGGTPTPTPTPTPAPRSETKPTMPDSPRERNHRRSYVNNAMEASPNLKRTPPGSPLRFDMTSKDTPSQLPRTRSFPLTADKLGRVEGAKSPLLVQTAPVGGGGSEESTPLLSPRSDCSQNDTSYKQFLDQFCFYTGADSFQDASETTLPRSQSVTSLERYLLSHSPPQSFGSHLPSRFVFDTMRSTTPPAVHV